MIVEYVDKKLIILSTLTYGIYIKVAYIPSFIITLVYIFQVQDLYKKFIF